MQHRMDHERAVYLRSMEQEARARGGAWLASVLRPTGCKLYSDMTTAQLRVCLDIFYTGGTARPGVRGS